VSVLEPYVIFPLFDFDSLIPLQRKAKRLPADHPGYAPIDPQVVAAKTRRRGEKFARRAKKKGEKAAKKARLLAALPPGYFEEKRAAREEKRRQRHEKTADMRAKGIEREGKGRSPRNVRKEKKAMKLLKEAGKFGTGANTAEVGMNRMAKRMMGGQGMGDGYQGRGRTQRA